MKTIGLVGGATWHSTVDYYRYFNEMVNESLGGDEAARVIINSINYGEIRKLTEANDWKKISTIVCTAAKKAVDAGAECILLGANTMHVVADDVERAIDVPLIHIAKETGKVINKLGIAKVALLGTRYTMQMDFFSNTLSMCGIETMIPDEEGIEIINLAIYEELAKGMILDPTRKNFITIIDKLAGTGADGVILGCTEIPLLIRPQDCPLPVFDTTRIHARAAVDFALGI